MAIDDAHIDASEFSRRITGDDTPPLISKVPEPPPSHWGKLTSRGRTLSADYQAFLKRNTEVRDGTRTTR